MRQLWTTLGVLAVALPVMGAQTEKAATKPNSLTPAQIGDGWIMLFDGQTKFGWESGGKVSFENAAVKVGGGDENAVVTTTTEFGDFELSFEYRGDRPPVLLMNYRDAEFEAPTKTGQWIPVKVTVTSQADQSTTEIVVGGKGKPQKHIAAGRSRTAVGLGVPAKSQLELRSVYLKPLGAKSLFNGKDLTGWKEIPGKASKFTVTPKGELNVKDGNGDLQSEGQWSDFVLQLDIISYGEHLNSGVFFRSLPGEFWQGYEAQVRNEWKGYEKGKPRDAENEDRTKPVDYGTGGLYNRQPSRKVVSDDKEWFTMTVVAHDLHFAVWVNGYQTADFVDEKPAAPSARKGSFRGKGCISLQGHDPTTDLSFRNIRVAELPEAKAAR